MDYFPLLISLEIAILATIVTLPLGLLTAWRVSLLPKGKLLWDCLFTLPLVLPPTVIGFLLLLLVGRNGVMGELLLQAGISLVFTRGGAVLAAVCVSFPIMYRGIRGALAQVNVDFLQAGRSLGMGELKLLVRIWIPCAWPGILAGVVLSFARALGEFGATIMIAGNIPGRTQTMSVAVYTAMQSGDRQLAYEWVGVMLGLSFVMLLLIGCLERKRGKTA